MSCEGCSCRPSDMDFTRLECSKRLFGIYTIKCDPDCCPDCNAPKSQPVQLNPVGIPIVNAPVETGTSYMIETVSDEIPFPRLGAPFEESLRLPGTQSFRDVLLLGQRIRPGEFTIESLLKLLALLIILLVASTVVIFA